MERRKFVQQPGVPMAAAPLIHTALPASAEKAAPATAAVSEAPTATTALRRAFASAKPCVIEVSVDRMKNLLNRMKSKLKHTAMHRLKIYLYLALIALTAACSPRGPLALFQRLSPHNNYAEKLKSAGLDHTAMGTDWLNAAVNSYARPVDITCRTGKQVISALPRLGQARCVSQQSADNS